jgi:N6-adenosine-specific RNA methylase IME4
MRINIFEKFDDGWGYDLFNIPVWKYKDNLGNTIVRGMLPRLNTPFLHIFLEDCIYKICCRELKNSDLNKMD